MKGNSIHFIRNLSRLYFRCSSSSNSTNIREVFSNLKAVSQLLMPTDNALSAMAHQLSIVGFPEPVSHPIPTTICQTVHHDLTMGGSK